MGGICWSDLTIFLPVTDNCVYFLHHQSSTPLLGSTRLLSSTPHLGSTDLQGSTHLLGSNGPNKGNGPTEGNGNGPNKDSNIYKFLMFAIFSLFTLYTNSATVLEWWLWIYMQRSRVEVPIKNDPYLDRKQLKEILSMHVSTYNSKNQGSDLRTVLVCGPRGGGKSTIVAELLNEKKGVLRVSLNKMKDLESVYTQLMNEVGIKFLPFGATRKGIIENALKAFKKKEFRPTLVFEVNFQCSTDELQDLLFLLKEWGSDRECVKPIVVLSVARVEMSRTIGLARIVHVPYLTLAEVKEFLDKTLTSVCENKIERLRVVESYAPRLGRLLNSLHDLKSDLRRCSSLDDAERILDMHMYNKLLNYREALETFFHMIRNKNSKTSLEDCITLLKKMQGSKDMFLSQFCALLDIPPRPVMIDLLADIYPHLFYLDPKTSIVSFASPIVEEVVKDFTKINSSNLMKIIKYLFPRY